MASLQQYNPQVISKRRERDIMKLLMSNYKVTQNKENPLDFIVEFQGPQNTLYQDGLWNIHVLLPEQYPYKSPSIGFMNKIYHPNVDEASGTVCLDVINQTWSPMFDLINVFDVFLPQLLSYPNPNDPLNPYAANEMQNDNAKYQIKVKEYVKKYAQKQNLNNPNKEEEIKKIRKESKALTDPRKESEDIQEDLSNISQSDLSELSQHSQLELAEEYIQQY